MRQHSKHVAVAVSESNKIFYSTNYASLCLHMQVFMYIWNLTTAISASTTACTPVD